MIHLAGIAECSEYTISDQIDSAFHEIRIEHELVRGYSLALTIVVHAYERLRFRSVRRDLPAKYRGVSEVFQTWASIARVSDACHLFITIYLAYTENPIMLRT